MARDRYAGGGAVWAANIGDAAPLGRARRMRLPAGHPWRGTRAVFLRQDRARLFRGWQGRLYPGYAAFPVPVVALFPTSPGIGVLTRCCWLTNVYFDRRGHLAPMRDRAGARIPHPAGNRGAWSAGETDLMGPPQRAESERSSAGDGMENLNEAPFLGRMWLDTP